MKTILAKVDDSENHLPMKSNRRLLKERLSERNMQDTLSYSRADPFDEFPLFRDRNASFPAKLSAYRAACCCP